MSDNKSFVDLIVTGAISIGAAVFAVLRVKGKSDEQIKTVQKYVEKQELALKDRVHVNDFKSHQKLVETHFDYIKKKQDEISTQQGETNTLLQDIQIELARRNTPK